MNDERSFPLSATSTLRMALLFIVTAIFLTATHSSAATTRHHGAHVHGIGALNVAQENSELFIELTTPAANLVGFEHTPRTEQQKKAVHEAVEQLQTALEIFSFPAAAGCEIKGAEVRHDMGEDDHYDETHHHDEAHHHEDKHHDEKDGHGEAGHDHGGEAHDHDEDHGEDAAHSEFLVRYNFVCTSPDELSSIDVMLFERFSGFEAIDVQAITTRGQASQRLTPADHRVTLP